MSILSRCRSNFAPFWDGRFSHWIEEVRIAGLAVTVLLLVVIVILVSGGSERAFRLGGLALELAGLVAAARAISKAQLFFGQPSLRESTKKWWQGSPWHPQNAIAGGESFTVAVTMNAGRATGGSNPAALLPEQVAQLQADVKRLDEALWRSNQATDERFAKVRAELAMQAQANAEERRNLKEHLTRAQTDGLGEARMSLAWVIVGAVFNGAAMEISCGVRQMLGLLG